MRISLKYGSQVNELTRTLTDKPWALGRHNEPSSNTDFQYEMKVPGEVGAVKSTVSLTVAPGSV